ncbi:MAG: hypothetical protein FWF90_05155 [Promicromonosporaceae bacterium]|nr:hypothetical protein [Promicromonosporaceae bacterium]
MTDGEPQSALAKLAEGLENDSRLDGLRSWYRRLAGVLPSGRALDELRGQSLGHPLHPALTAMPLGMWTAAVVLDLTGGDPDAARRLVGAGFLAAAPTAASGLADWSALRSVESSRVGALHAGLNGFGAAVFGLSWCLRRSGRHRAGVMTSLVGATIVGASAYLGGHLVFRRGEPAASGGA